MVPGLSDSDHFVEINEMIFAGVPRATWAGPFGGERINRNIARSEGFIESLGSAWGQGVYGLFEEMEEKDAHLYSILQTRKYGLLARQRTVEPASPSESDGNIRQDARRTSETWGVNVSEIPVSQLLDS